MKCEKCAILDSSVCRYEEYRWWKAKVADRDAPGGDSADEGVYLQYDDGDAVGGPQPGSSCTPVHLYN
jgi:hypothetical protein